MNQANKCNRPFNDKKKDIIRASSIINRGEQLFFQTDLSVIDHLFNLSLLGEECSFVHKSCWLAGGSLLRWLSCNGKAIENTDYDRDFFFPSRRDLLTVFEKMLRNNYCVIRFNFKKRKLIHRTCLTATDCDILHETPAMILASRKIKDTLAREDLVMVELQSSRGIRCQLIAGYNGCDPVDVIRNFDYSICQLAIDDKYIYAGSSTWHDLFQKKLRYAGNTTNMQTAWRFIKFINMGYHPTVQSVAVAIKSCILTPTFIGR